MIKQNCIESHLTASSTFMHIVLLQLVVKTLVKRGVNAPIYMVSKDKRLKKYKSSLLGGIQTNVREGHIFSNYYPNFVVDSTCPMTIEALKLDVHVQGDEFYDFKNFVIYILTLF